MINKPISYRFEFLNQEDIYELMTEIIPGISHKSNNILTKISGQVLLDHMQNKRESDDNSLHIVLPELCDQLAKLLDKLLMMVHSPDQASKRIKALDCLSSSIERFNIADPNRVVTLNNLLPDECKIWGEYHRLQRSYYFILMMLDECINSSDAIRVNASLMTKSLSLDLYPDKNKDLLCIQVTFSTDSGGNEMSLYNNDFYHPEGTVNLLTCYQAAADNIFLSFGGQMHINIEEGIQIITEFPIREESPLTPKHQGKIHKKRVYFHPINQDSRSTVRK